MRVPGGTVRVPGGTGRVPGGTGRYREGTGRYREGTGAPEPGQLRRRGLFGAVRPVFALFFRENLDVRLSSEALSWSSRMAKRLL